METLELSLDFIEVPVKLTSKDGEKKEWTLREFDGDVRDKYLNGIAKRMKLDMNGKPTQAANFDGLQSSLLTLCLFDKNGESVSEEEIQKLPAKTQQVLFDKAQEICGLDTDEEDKKEGND